MSTGKCNLLKPVTDMTGTFFMFSQYAQDLTKEYTQQEAYRCIPSKYIALKLNTDGLGSDDAARSKKLGEIFQNYFENACSVWRAEKHTDDSDMDPEHTRTLLFQTLEKYNLISFDTTTDVTRSGGSTGNVVAAYCTSIQHIGDVNLYSYDTNADGVGYNEVYVYIPNEAKETDAYCTGVEEDEQVKYTNTDISGYSGQSYNGLSWSVSGYVDSIIESGAATTGYCLGSYTDSSSAKQTALIPYALTDNTESDDNIAADNATERTNDREVESQEFDINAIIVFYDITCDDTTPDNAKYHNIPMGIYFAGAPQATDFTNTIRKFVRNDTVYNQGTSYGLRICSRFTVNPNTYVVENESASAQAFPISYISPLIDKFTYSVECVSDIISGANKQYDLVKEHLTEFRNNKTNVPYVRQIADKKYWFVNGKNTGAIAQFDNIITDAEITKIVKALDDGGKYYSKTQIDNAFADYSTTVQMNSALTALETKLTNLISSSISDLESRLNIYTLGVTENTSDESNQTEE